MRAHVQKLWSGDVPMVQAFWEYAILYGSVANLLTTVASFGLISAGAPGALALLVFLLPVPYNIFMVVAVWRSAGRYAGPRLWADLARAAIVAWAVIVCAA